MSRPSLQRWTRRPMPKGSPKPLGVRVRTPDAIRQRRVRRRRRLGLRIVHVEISEEIIELLEKRGYDPRRDEASIGQAVTALLSDLVLDTA